MESIYGTQPFGWLTAFPKRAAKGRPWVEIAKNTNLFLNVQSFKANNGRKIRFWKDHWIGDQPMENTFPDLYILSARKEDTIHNCWNTEQQDWNLSFRRGLFDREFGSCLGLINKLDTIRLGEATDEVRWRIEASGSFTTKSTFFHLT